MPKVRNLAFLLLVAVLAPALPSPAAAYDCYGWVWDSANQNMEFIDPTCYDTESPNWPSVMQAFDNWAASEDCDEVCGECAPYPWNSGFGSADAIYQQCTGTLFRGGIRCECSHVY